MHFDFLYTGKSAVDVGVDAADGFQYVLVILEVVSSRCNRLERARQTAPWKSLFAGVPRLGR